MHKHLSAGFEGISQSFVDKQQHFFELLRSSHSRTGDTNVFIKLNRRSLGGYVHKITAGQGLKALSVADWQKKLVVQFDGEPGQDYGGLRREFFEVLSNYLFDAAPPDGPNSLARPFVRLVGGSELVHPNHMCSDLKLFEAIGLLIGKALLDSAVLEPTHLNMHFTKSFWKMIVGEMPSPSDLEVDDRQLYMSKIRYMQENSVADLELTFSEEDVNEAGQTTVVDLKKDGRSISVTDGNKHEYPPFVSWFHWPKSLA